MTGKVVRVFFSKGFGFLLDEAGASRFFHASGFEDSRDFNSLREGQELSFRPEDSPKGPRAVDLRLR